MTKVKLRFNFWSLLDSLCVKVTQLYPTLCDPINYSPWNSPGQNTGVGSFSLLQGIFPTQGSNPGLPRCRHPLQAPRCRHSLPAEPQGKPKNTGVGSLSLLQWIFHIQEPNGGLLHGRWILYQLSYQGSPRPKNNGFFTFLSSNEKRGKLNDFQSTSN